MSAGRVPKRRLESTTTGELRASRAGRTATHASPAAAAASSSSVQNQNQCFITSLPDELLVNLLQYVSYKDLARCARVCRSWRKLSSENSLWKRHTIAHCYGLYDPKGYVKGSSRTIFRWEEEDKWKIAFIELYKIHRHLRMQVYERENHSMEFRQSWYDADVYPTATSNNVTAAFLAQGSRTRIIEGSVSRWRLRQIPYEVTRLNRHGVYRDPSVRAEDFVIGEIVEIQWQKYKTHPMGWWLGKVSVVDVEQQTVSVKFEIYENQPGFEAYVYEVVHLTSPQATEGTSQIGWVGGIRKAEAPPIDPAH